MAETESGGHPPRRAGRPTKLTPEVADRICQAIAGGNYREVAAAWAGIGERTLRDWMRRGENPRSVYHDFRRRVLEAEQAAEIRAVGLIMASAAKDPKHAEWWLQRKHPERWGRKDRLQTEITGPGGGPIGVDVSAREELAGLIARLAARVEAQDGAKGEG